MNIKEEIFKKYGLEENDVSIFPIDRYAWRISDEEGAITLSPDDFVCLATHYAQLNEELTGIEPFDGAIFKAYRQKKSLNNQ